MKTIKQSVIFFVLLLKSLVGRKYILNTHIDFLNASDIVYIHNTEDPKTGLLYMHINFATHHKLCIMFRTKQEYDETVKKITNEK